MPGNIARVLHLPALPKRADSQQRVFIGSVAVVSVATIVAASVALASAPEPQHRTHRTQAERVAAYPPSYTVPVGTLIAGGKVGNPSLTGDTGSQGVPAGTAAQPTTPDTKQVPANTAAIATYQGGSGTLTPAGIATLALEAGCSSANAVTATAISMAESGGSPGAQGDIALMNATWDWSAGLWQIRGLRSERNTGQLRDSVANQNAVHNAKAMYTISSGCTSWGPWTTYTRGLYARYLVIATQAVNYVVRYFDAHGSHYPTVAPPDPNAPIPTGGGAGAVQAAGPAPASSSKAKSHGKTKKSKSKKPHAASSSTAAAAGGGSTKGSGSGGGAKSSPSAAASSAAGAASKVTKPVKSAASSLTSAASSIISKATCIVSLTHKC